MKSGWILKDNNNEEYFDNFQKNLNKILQNDVIFRRTEQLKTQKNTIIKGIEYGYITKDFQEIRKFDSVSQYITRLHQKPGTAESALTAAIKDNPESCELCNDYNSMMHVIYGCNRTKINTRKYLNHNLKKASNILETVIKNDLDKKIKNKFQSYDVKNAIGLGTFEGKFHLYDLDVIDLLISFNTKYQINETPKIFPKKIQLP